MGEGPAQQKALIGPEDTTSFTGGFDEKTNDTSSHCDKGKFDHESLLVQLLFEGFTQERLKLVLK